MDRLGGTGKVVILPVDQGFEHGPARSFAKNAQGYDPHFHFQLAIEAGCNAYAAPLGFLEAGAGEFAGDVPLILKLNNSDSLLSDGDPCPAVTGSVADALRLGCSAIGFTVYPGSSFRNEMYGQIRELGEEAKACGLAVVIWSYDKGDFSMRMDIETGQLVDILLDYTIGGDERDLSYSGARVSGARVSGARVSGARVSGARVSGARVGGSGD